MALVRTCAAITSPFRGRLHRPDRGDVAQSRASPGSQRNCSRQYPGNQSHETKPAVRRSSISKEASAFADAVSNARTVLVVLAVVGLYVFGVAFLIYSKRWQAFGRKISIAAALLIGLGVFSTFYFQA